MALAGTWFSSAWPLASCPGCACTEVPSVYLDITLSYNDPETRLALSGQWLFPRLPDMVTQLLWGMHNAVFPNLFIWTQIQRLLIGMTHTV